LPNYPHHIIQWGHNRQKVFVNDEDYLYYLENLKEWKENLGCKVYSYCLMENHIHLVVDPGEEIRNLALLMKRISARQTRYVNRQKKRRGTLWEGRYKSSPIKVDEYLLACCRYVELNPVRVGIVRDPGEYRWSSYRYKVGLEGLGGIDLDPLYRGLGSTKKRCRERYRQWVNEEVPRGEWELIGQAVHRGQLTGSFRFIEEVHKRFDRWIVFRGQGRPKKGKK
ncbi:MAG: transposase, partial [Thermodesulfobacteriota bacterium]|nr:transposase [Thermodesulfobacteriota bacterium]